MLDVSVEARKYFPVLLLRVGEQLDGSSGARLCTWGASLQLKASLLVSEKYTVRIFNQCVDLLASMLSTDDSCV